MNDLSLVPWSVSQSPIRVVIIIIMDHIIIIIGEWRSDAICNDPRVWINHGSTMDQHGSTWINVDQPSSACRLQPARRGSRVMRPDSCVTCHASHVLTHESCVPLTWQASCVPLTWQASCVPLTWQASCVPFTWQASCVPLSTVQPPPVVGHDDNRDGGHLSMRYPYQICAC